jgi:hypothetical protein
MISMEEADDRFYISESTQPGAERGLFAARDIAEGDFIEVKGVMVEKGSVADDCTRYADSFKFASDYADSYTHHIIPIGYAGMVNHANESQSGNVKIRHVVVAGERLCVYRFARDVSKGEEILGDYGEEWGRINDWSRMVNESAEETEDREWRSFLGRGLYKLDKLRAIEEKNAKYK